MNKGTNMTHTEQLALLTSRFPDANSILKVDGLWEVTEIIGDISEERDLYAYVPGTKKFNFIGHISVEI